MNEQIHDKLKAIKQSFRLQMNGVASQSMRDSGVSYKLNWGIAVPTLRQMASEYDEDYELAIELWKENPRECKIMATMLMPRGVMLPEVAELWMEQAPTQELAELLAMNVFQYLDYAPMMAYRWLALDDDRHQITAYNILSRLFSQGQEPDERGITELIDQALASIQGGTVAVKHAAYNCLTKLSGLDEAYERVVRGALRQVGIEFV